MAHPAFGHAADRVVFRNFTTDCDTDDDGHGTHCAGTFFGGTVDGVRIGVAPQVSKALVAKVVGTQGCSTEQLIDAIEWAVAGGAQVVSMSLGMDYPGLVKSYELDGYPTELAASRALEGYRMNIDLFRTLVEYQTTRAGPKGLIFVAAVGNESRRDQRPDFSVAAAPPAATKGVVSVGALGLRRGGYEVAPYSNTGSSLCAPGSDIVSARSGGGLAIMTGTSMATPHVAGVAALWAQSISDRRGQFITRHLIAKLEGHATTKGFAAVPQPEQVGAGLVRAPVSTM